MQTPQGTDAKPHRMRAVGYSRVSRDEEQTRPDDDEHRINLACELWGYDLLEPFIVDRGVSGKVPLGERDQGKRIDALLDMPKPWADVVIVSALDRLTRETEDGSSLLKRFVRNGRRNPISLIALDDHIDLASASGRYFFRMRIAHAEFERELVGERTSNALQFRKRTGLAYGGTPYGWDRQDEVVGNKTIRHLVRNDAEQAMIVNMLSLRHINRWNDNQIATDLNFNSVPTKGRIDKNGVVTVGRWQAVTVARVLKTTEQSLLETHNCADMDEFRNRYGIIFHPGPNPDCPICMAA